MTDIRKSDAQLDAEASAPYAPLTPRIALHRALAQGDVAIVKLHQRDGEFGIGLPFSHPFAAFLDAWYGNLHWLKGLETLAAECERRHHDAELCARLVNLTCRYDFSWTAACERLAVDPERTEATMHRALRRIEEKMRELQAKATEVVKSDEGRNEWWTAPHVHHVVPGLHLEECEQCGRVA